MEGSAQINVDEVFQNEGFLENKGSKSVVEIWTRLLEHYFWLSCCSLDDTFGTIVFFPRLQGPNAHRNFYLLIKGHFVNLSPIQAYRGSFFS